MAASDRHHSALYAVNIAEVYYPLALARVMWGVLLGVGVRDPVIFVPGPVQFPRSATIGSTRAARRAGT